jgi:hypothetical protein
LGLLDDSGLGKAPGRWLARREVGGGEGEALAAAAVGGGEGGANPERILVVCIKICGEIGRRRHLIGIYQSFILI